MAILQHFRKIDETPAQVEYVFGFPDLDRMLVISVVGAAFKLGLVARVNDAGVG